MIRDRLSAHDGRRRVINHLMRFALLLTAIVAVIPLISVFAYVIQKGAPAIHLSFFLNGPKPIGETGGGMGNALLGTAILVALASLGGIPIGIGTGLYLSEYGGSSKIATTLRFVIDLLGSIPSIIVGIFAYAAVVVPMKRFSAVAGGAALAVLMIPTVARTTEELLKLVPTHIREAGLALGIPRWKVTLRIVLRGSLGAITTGVMLGVARAAGETAPLLLTSLNSSFWPKSLDQPISSLPVQIYTYAISPYEDWHQQAWAAALVLVLFVFALNLGTRLVIRRQPMVKD